MSRPRVRPADVVSIHLGTPSVLQDRPLNFLLRQQRLSLWTALCVEHISGIESYVLTFFVTVGSPQMTEELKTLPGDVLVFGHTEEP